MFTLPLKMLATVESKGRTMNKKIIPIATACVAALLAGGLFACASPSQTSASTAPASTSSQSNENASRADVEAVLNPAIAAEYDNLSFRMETDATVSATVEGKTQQQSQNTTSVGELAKSGDNKALHLNFSSSSTAEPGKTSYELFINGDGIVIKQGDKMYSDVSNKESLENNIQSITRITSADEIKNILDTASSYKLEKKDGETTVFITADTSKLGDSKLIDASSLPEGSSIATFVTSYTVDADNHFKTVRVMSNTAGAPTYHVSQTYQFSNYNETSLPAWPDMNAYLAEQAGLSTDENGKMYFTDENGQIYYVDYIDDDGMIHFNSSVETVGGGMAGGGATTTRRQSTGNAPSNNGNSNNSNIKKDDPNEKANPSFAEGDKTPTESESTAKGSNTKGTSTNSQGRAYITGSDGRIHYLDEPGSEIRDLGGSKVFIDADGEWYFLNG